MVIGVFSDRGIEKLVQDGNISSSTKITPEQIQPSSIDLTVGNIGFCLKYSSIPDGTNLKEYFSRVKNYQISPENGVHMHKDQIYVVKLNERLNFKNNPTPILARANPKSSTGRTDIQVRLITESGKEFDNVPENYSGDLWLEIVPRSFDIYLKSGIALNQLRIFNQSLSPLSYSELELAHSETGLIFKKGRKEKLNFSSEKVIQVSVDLSRKLGAYVARSDCTSVVDLTRKDNKTSEFFREVYTEDNSIILIPNRFYILSSTEEINIPLECCGEMGDIQTSIGEFRAHYAGFFDPGFSSTAVLEVRNLGAPFKITHRQNIASMIYYRLKENSTSAYGTCGSNYQGQKRLKLAKFFVEKK